MGLTCSVLGHRYGDREHIEERDRQGSEELIAIREVKTCERCGEELIVSESKEVLAVENDEDETEADDPPTPEESGVDPAEPDLIEEAEPEPAAEDEGIILVDEDSDREPGEWPLLEDENDDAPEEEDPMAWPEVRPNEAESPAADPSPWPEMDGEDEGFDAVAGDGDQESAAQIIEAAATAPAEDVEETDAGFFRASPIDSPADPDEDVHSVFFCPRCDWSARSLTTSVRRGDICPNCQTGYIAEREA